MDEANPQNQNPRKPSFLGALEFGFLEIAFVTVVLILLFGTLNYFNILSLSKTFPQYFSWLPTQPFPIIATKQPPITQTPNPNPTLSIKIENDIKTYIDDVLLPSVISPNAVYEKQEVQNPNNFTFYGTGWKLDTKEIIIPTIEYNQKDEIIDRQVIVHIPKITQGLNASFSAILIKKYFVIAPKSQFTCITLPITNIKSIFCESFWEDNGIKKGIDVTSPIQGLNETRIFYCEHHKGTPAYSWKSCNLSYKDTGIQ